MMPLLLELVSGTGSVGKVAKEFGYEVISLDKDMETDIKCNIFITNDDDEADIGFQFKFLP